MIATKRMTSIRFCIRLKRHRNIMGETLSRPKKKDEPRCCHGPYLTLASGLTFYLFGIKVAFVVGQVVCDFLGGKGVGAV